jgi:hypothetical protein
VAGVQETCNFGASTGNPFTPTPCTLHTAPHWLTGVCARLLRRRPVLVPHMRQLRLPLRSRKISAPPVSSSPTTNRTHALTTTAQSCAHPAPVCSLAAARSSSQCSTVRPRSTTNHRPRVPRPLDTAHPCLPRVRRVHHVRDRETTTRLEHRRLPPTLVAHLLTIGCPLGMTTTTGAEGGPRHGARRSPGLHRPFVLLPLNRFFTPPTDHCSQDKAVEEAKYRMSRYGVT